jgi:LPS-assembly protein
VTTLTRLLVALAASLGLLAAAPAAAQTPPVTVPTASGDVTVIADQIEEIGADRLVVATGNVEVIRGSARLKADRVEMNRDTGDAVATGRVTFDDGESRLSAERIDYNFRSGTGIVYDGAARTAPYYRLSGERMERVGESVYRVQHGVFTTCDADPPDWSVRMKSAIADLNSYVWGTSASFWVRRLPLIPWVPYFAASIRRERQTGFLFPTFGHSSDKGFFAGLPFFWAISDSQDVTVRLTVYERRGVGATADYRYILGAENAGTAKGFLIHESGRDADQEVAGLPPPERQDRGWGSARHDWAIARGLTLKADVNMVTDDTVLREYSDSLHQRGVQRVESDVFLTRNWDSWSAVADLFWYQDLTARRPVELHRLPDLSLQGMRQPVPWIPGLLWEFDAGVVRFVREVGSDGTRVDVRPRLSRPISLGGLATLTPFAGARLTGYDRRFAGVRIDRDGRAIEKAEDDLRLRRLVEVGGDLASLVSRTFGVGGWQGLDALLHSIEPRITYTHIEGWDLDRLPQWTNVEQIRSTSLVEYSVTNRVRAKTVAPPGTEPLRVEMLRFILGHALDLRPGQQRSGDVFADLLFQTGRGVYFRGDLRHDTHGRGIQTFNTDISVGVPRVSASVGTRYSDPARLTYLQGGLSVEVARHVTGRASTNWDVRTDTLVESRVAVDLKYQCWALTVEYIKRNPLAGAEDEVRIALNLLGVGAPIGTTFGLGALTGGTSTR